MRGGPCGLPFIQHDLLRGEVVLVTGNFMGRDAVVGPTPERPACWPCPLYRFQRAAHPTCLAPGIWGHDTTPCRSFAAMGCFCSGWLWFIVHPRVSCVTLD